MNVTLKIIVLLGVIVLLSGCNQKTIPPGTYDEFAKCTVEKGAVMYGAYWCQHCAKVKAEFGDSFKYVNYVECDPKCVPDAQGNLPYFCEGHESQSDKCLELDIEAYATFIFSDGSRLVGEPTLQEISGKTGCKLPEGA